MRFIFFKILFLKILKLNLNDSIHIIKEKKVVLEEEIKMCFNFLKMIKILGHFKMKNIKLLIIIRRRSIYLFSMRKEKREELCASFKI